MKRALLLSEKGRGQVSPNPLVGAVIVKDGQFIAEGYHQQFGQAHAEVNALLKAGDAAAGATLYVNLEPCSHQGKTGPCTEAILKAGIARVVIGMRDPNPQVDGRGVTFLRSKGISVTESVLEEQCRELNRGFIHAQKNWSALSIDQDRSDFGRSDRHQHRPFQMDHCRAIQKNGPSDSGKA